MFAKIEALLQIFVNFAALFEKFSNFKIKLELEVLEPEEDWRPLMRNQIGFGRQGTATRSSHSVANIGHEVKFLHHDLL